MFAVKLVISIKLRMFNEYTTYPLAKIGSCYGKLLSWIWQTKFLWLDNLSNNPSWKSGKHGNNIRHSQLIHLPNMSILTMLEAYSNNLHELATVYWGQKKSQIKSGKYYCILIQIVIYQWNSMINSLLKKQHRNKFSILRDSSVFVFHLILFLALGHTQSVSKSNFPTIDLSYEEYRSAVHRWIIAAKREKDSFVVFVSYLHWDLYSPQMSLFL